MSEEQQFAFKLKQDVIINTNGLHGKVNTQWRSVGGQDQFQVEYANSSGTVCRDWFIAEDLTA